MGRLVSSNFDNALYYSRMEILEKKKNTSPLIAFYCAHKI